MPWEIDEEVEAVADEQEEEEEEEEQKQEDVEDEKEGRRRRHLILPHPNITNACPSLSTGSTCLSEALIPRSLLSLLPDAQF